MNYGGYQQYPGQQPQGYDQGFNNQGMGMQQPGFGMQQPGMQMNMGMQPGMNQGFGMNMGMQQPGYGMQQPGMQMNMGMQQPGYGMQQQYGQPQTQPMMPQQQPGMMPQTQQMMPQAQPGMMPQQQPGMMPQQQPGMMPQQQPGMMPQQQPGMMPQQMLPQKPFNAEQDCDVLRKAMKGLGTDEDTIIKLVCNRTSAQRQQIKKMYATAFGKDLCKELKSELGGKLEDCVLALFDTPVEYDCKCLYGAMHGLGTDEDTLIEILATRSNQHLAAVKTEFQKMYKKDLCKYVESETSGHFRRLLVSLLQCNRSENMYPNPQECQKYADELYTAGEAKWGTDESQFNKVFAVKSPAELAMIAQLYQQKSGKTLYNVIQKEFSGNMEKCLLAILTATINTHEYFATRVNKSIKGAGTNDKLLIRVLVTRDEIDMPQIKACYKRLYGRELIGDVRGDTSGDYRKFLVELAGH